MIWIYRRAASESARDLAEALDGRRARSINRLTKSCRPGDRIICWGEEGDRRFMNQYRGEWVTYPVLNGAPLRSKYSDIQLLTRAGIPTVVASQAPIPRPNEVWVGRSFNHIGGNDLLHPSLRPDYWVKRETFTREYRVHSFRGRSIRAGIKVAREGATPHEWIRSWNGGWRISYNGVSVKQRHRDLAHRAVQALGLDFAAVDIGQKANRDLVVLELNRCPGLEAGTIAAYAQAVNRWVEEP